MSEIIDISLPLHPDLTIWPESAPFRLTRRLSIEAGSEANVSDFQCDAHMGTHVDAPQHFVQDGLTVEQLALDTLIGPAVVAYLPDVDAITAATLDALRLPPDVERLLVRTRNSQWWADGTPGFREDFVALTADAAQWVVDRGIRLIGVDYLSVQRYHDAPLTHQLLLGAGVIILEGLNLADVAPGTYEVICLPLKLLGAEGAPARTVLRPLQPG